MLQPLMLLSVLVGDKSAITFVQQQKLDGYELPALAFLQTVAGNPAASQATLQKEGAVNPWVSPRGLEISQIYFDAVAAVEKGDGQAALSRLAQAAEIQRPDLLFFRGRAHLLTNDYASAETDFRSALRLGRSLENGYFLAIRLPALGILSHYYLAQLYERTNKHDDAVNEYQNFLSYFPASQNRLPQVAEARAALKRLMQ